MTRPKVFDHLDAARHARSPLHADDRIWVDKNCYVDLWIELLHTLRLEPLAVMGFTHIVDFQRDHWTFYKPPHAELRALYGIDVQELNLWRPLQEHAVDLLSNDVLLCVESDAFWLPDTAGIDYRQNHVKTSIVMADLDTGNQTLGYFHNAGYYALNGDDYRGTLLLDPPKAGFRLPLFAEEIRIDRLSHLPVDELAARSYRELLLHHAWRPRDNPVRRFAQRFAEDLPALQERGLAHYHAWAFGSIRQLGSAFELAALQMEWLADQGHAAVRPAAAPFLQIAEGAKSLILKAARSVNSRRPLDADALFDRMAQGWDDGTRVLDNL